MFWPSVYFIHWLKPEHVGKQHPKSKHLGFGVYSGQKSSDRFDGMIPTLSTRAFKHLHKISRKDGLQNTDEEIHDMGVRLLSLCHIAANVKNREDKTLKNLLTETEIQALEILRKQFTTSGRLSSVRELSNALGYKSSRSGHLVLQSLLTKKLLVRIGGQLTFPRE